MREDADDVDGDRFDFLLAQLAMLKLLRAGNDREYGDRSSS